MSTETTSIKLLKQEDWTVWFDFIRSNAMATKIWRFVNPDEETPQVNVEPNLLYYTQNRTVTSTPNSTDTAQGTSTSTSNLIQPPTDPELEQYLAGQDSTGRWNAYKDKRAQYDGIEKGLAALSLLIRTTVGPNFSNYLFNEHNPHKLLRTLQRVANPSKATLRQAIKTDIERLETGPKRLGVDTWLNLYTQIYTKAKQIENPPYEATTSYLISHFIQSSYMVNPNFNSEYGQKADEEALNFTLEEMIHKFNLSYRPSRGYRAAFPTLAGEPIDNRTDEPKPYSPNIASEISKHKKCWACGGRHNIKRCRNLFEELRPEGWVVNERQGRRCQEYLKTPEGKALYREQKKYFATHPPEKPTLKPSLTKRRATEDPDSQ